MLFYLVIALVAIRAKTFKAVIIWIVLLQVLGLLFSVFIFMYNPAFDSEQLITHQLMSFVIKIIIGTPLYWLFNRKRKYAVSEEYMRHRKLASAFLSILIVIMLLVNAITILAGIKHGQRLIEGAQLAAQANQDKEEEHSSATTQQKIIVEKEKPQTFTMVTDEDGEIVGYAPPQDMSKVNPVTQQPTLRAARERKDEVTAQRKD